MSSWDEVGGNPSPGDAGELRERARALQAVCDHGHDLEGRLRDLHSGLDADWVGDGAEGMKSAAQQNLPDLVEMWSSHKDAAGALGVYADRLEEFQQRAGNALRDYSQAANDLQSAQREHEDAAIRHGAASNEVWRQDTNLVALRARRVVSMATQQPTAALDHEIASAEDTRHYQDGLAQEAARDLTAARTKTDDANDRMNRARQQIAGVRDEAERQARSTGDAILAAIGVVNSHNPLVRFADNVVHGGGSALKWFSDNALSSFDEAIAVLSIAAMIPVLTPFLAPIVVGLSLVSLIGHTYRYLNGQEGTADEAMAVIGVLPFGGVLKAMSKSKAPAEELEKLRGLVKRGVYTSDARKAKGVLHRVHAVPQRQRGPEWLYEYAIAGAIAKKGVQAHDLIEQGVHLVEQGATSIDRRNQTPSIPATTVQLQTSSLAYLSMINPAFRISLLGDWRPVDLANPLPDDSQAQARRELQEAGLLIHRSPPGSRLLLAAVLTANAGDDDEPEPILASVLIHEHSGAVQTRVSGDGDVLPDRQVRVLEATWPDPQVGSVKLHEVKYTIACPDTTTYVTVVFASPNLPHAAELEWVYETMIGTAAWVQTNQAG